MKKELDCVLVKVYCEEDPEEHIIICDMDRGRDFAPPHLLFAHPEYVDSERNQHGLIAMGGRITIDMLLKSYRWGIFPWYDFREKTPRWYCPRQRYVIFPERVHVSHSMRNLFNKNKYRVTIDEAFDRVIEECSRVSDRHLQPGAWLGEELIEKFKILNKLGVSKSVEVWEGDELVGGFYGFWHNGVLQGDSMFSLAPSASKYGLIWLCRHPFIDGEKIKFIDTQYETENFKSMGGEYISYEEYMKIKDGISIDKTVK